MRVAVTRGPMSMPMAMRTGRHGVMDVIVVIIVVPMRVLMFHIGVLMLMGMVFSQVQDHAGQHQQAAQRQAPAR